MNLKISPCHHVKGSWLLANIWLMLSLSYLRRKLGQLCSGNNLSYKVGVDGVANTLKSAPSAVKQILRWAFNDVLHACVQFNNCQLAEHLFTEMQKIGLQPSNFTYDGFVKTVIAGKGIAYANKVIKAMERRGIGLYSDTLAALSVGHSNSSQLVLAEELLERISDIKPKHIRAFNALLSGCAIMIRAFGSEGMIEEMLRYLNIAENILWNINPYQKSDLYSIALHALVDAKETHRAVMIFKIMRSCNVPTDISIYNTMIECCKWLPCFKSASALLSLMLRDGFNPTVVTFTSLLKGQIHVLEYIVECIHRAKIQPDPSTLWYIFCAYEEHELYNTAIEALLVLSMRMISEDVSILSEKRIAFEDLILSEEPDAELRIIRAFQAGEEFLATALLNLRWCATMGATISWSPEESLWARRLASSYDANKRPHINPSDVPKSW